YVAHWSNTGEPLDPLAQAVWLDWLNQQQVDAIGWGLVTLRNCHPSSPVVRVDDLPGQRILGPDISAWFTRQAWLHEHDLLTPRYTPADGLELASMATLGSQGQWNAGQWLLTTSPGPGLRRTDEVTELLADIVAGCDGTISLRDHLARLAVSRN